MLHIVLGLIWWKVKMFSFDSFEYIYTYIYIDYFSYIRLFFRLFQLLFSSCFLAVFVVLPAVCLEKKKQMWLPTGSGICQRERARERGGTSANWYWPNQSMANCFVLALCNAPHWLSVCLAVPAFTFDSFDCFDIRQAAPPPVGQLLIDGRSQLPPFPYLSEVRQKLRLLVGHIDALRLRRLRLEAVQAAAQAGAVAYCLGASQSTWWWRCGHHGRCATSTDGHAKGAWRYIVILRLPIRFLWERKKTKNKTNKTFSVI